MKLKKILLWSMVPQVLLTSLTALAQAPADAVLTLTAVNPPGGAIVELPNGARVPARVGMNIPNNSQLLVMENAQVSGTYNSDGCAMNYGANTKLQVAANLPCSAGEPITKTVVQTTKSVVSADSVSRPVVTTRPVSSFSNLGFAGAAIALPVFFYAIQDNSNDKPISQLGKRF